MSVIERSKGAQIRVSIVRWAGRRGARISVSRWYRDPFKEGDDWQPDRRPWHGGPLIGIDDVPLVADAMRGSPPG